MQRVELLLDVIENIGGGIRWGPGRQGGLPLIVRLMDTALDVSVDHFRDHSLQVRCSLPEPHNIPWSQLR
jgi:hypothetical protein